MSTPPPAAPATPSMVLCPYCGSVQKAPIDKCRICSGFFDPLSRKVSQQHMGPWFIRDSAMPFRPGCSFDVIRKQCQKGKIKPDTILRGPTTRQFWTVAWRVPGVAHLIGFCHSCELQIPTGSQRCPKCGTPFVEPGDRHHLGLDADNPKIYADIAAARSGTAPAPTAQPATPASAILSPPLTTPPPPATGRVASMPGFSTAPAQARVVETRSLDDYGPAVTAPSDDQEDSSTPAIVNNMTGERAGVGDAPDWMESNGSYDAEGRIPSERGFESPASAAKSSSPLVWGLVGLNVILVLLIGGVMMTSEEPDPNAPNIDPVNPRQTSTGSPVSPATGPRQATAQIPAVQPGQTSIPATGTSTPDQPSTPTAPNESPVAGTPFVNSSRPRRTSNVEFFGSTFTVDESTGLTDEQAKSFQTRFDAAAADAAKGDYKSAVLKLEKLRVDLPFGVRNAGLDNAINKLNDLIRQEADTPAATPPADPAAKPATKADDRKELEDFFK